MGKHPQGNRLTCSVLAAWGCAAGVEEVAAGVGAAEGAAGLGFGCSSIACVGGHGQDSACSCMLPLDSGAPAYRPQT